MDHKPNWVYRRPKVDRRLVEDSGELLKLYGGLESILRADLKEIPDEDIKTTALTGGLHLSREDSGFGMSLHGEPVFNGAAIEEEADNIKEEAITEVVHHEELSYVTEEALKSEESVPEIDETSHQPGEIDDWKLAEEFHAKLGPELDVIRQQIASILNEGPILFPLELISRLYLGYGRRLPQLYEGYSSDKLLAWLKCNSGLELNQLISGL